MTYQRVHFDCSGWVIKPTVGVFVRISAESGCSFPSVAVFTAWREFSLPSPSAEFSVTLINPSSRASVEIDMSGTMGVAWLVLLLSMAVEWRGVMGYLQWVGGRNRSISVTGAILRWETHG